MVYFRAKNRVYLLRGRGRQDVRLKVEGSWCVDFRAEGSIDRSEEKDSLNAERRARDVEQRKQWEVDSCVSLLLVEGDAFGKTRCRLSFFLFFHPFAYRRYRVLSFVTIPSARRHFLRIDISFILAVLLHFFLTSVRSESSRKKKIAKWIKISLFLLRIW